MLSRRLRGAVSGTRWFSQDFVALRSIFQVPSQDVARSLRCPPSQRLFNSTAPIVESPPEPSPAPSTSISASSPTTLATSSSPTTAELHPSLSTLLPLLRAQPNHYITAHLHDRPYLLTVGDILHLPFHMRDVVSGDILRLNRASVLGSRDYTLKGAPYIDERLFECRVRVLGVESESMRVKEKTKQRQRRTKRVKSKHRFTVVRVAELKIKRLEDVAEIS